MKLSDLRVGSRFYSVFLMIFLGSFILSSIGCEPLRKKFVRQKKKDENAQQFIPVLDPIDYPAAVYSAEEGYRKHYSLWRVWHKELMVSLDEQGIDRRQKYLVGQLVTQLSEMSKFVTEEKQKGLKDLSDTLFEVQEELEKPSGMRNMYSIKRKIEQSDKKMLNEFNPKVLENDFIQ